MAKCKKAQVWFMDFAIAILVFSFVLISYYAYTANISKQDSAVFDGLISDSKAISSSMLSSGSPDNWDNNTVQIIGITDNNQRISEYKLANLNDMPYQDAKKLLGTVYDFFLFFVDANNTLLSLGSRCGYGSPDVEVNKTLISAAYYQKEDDELLDEINEIESEFEVTIDKNWKSKNEFVNNIENYEIAIIETPKFSGQEITKLESYASNGGIVFIEKRATDTLTSEDIFGITYFKRPSCSAGEGGEYWSKVTAKDQFLPLDIGAAYVPKECNYIEGNVNKFAEYNDSKISIAKWAYGEGVVYYFSDVELEEGSYDLQDDVKEGIKSRMIKCGKSGSVNVTSDYKNLVKTERILAYGSKPVRMVLYLWQ